ncbi:MAG: M48 family metallopeptidase [Anaerolineales bacterium]|nr:M48 family metallopeptidase [Anaerolineales bacterium]
MHQIEVNGLVVDVVRKDIKNLHLAVYPPTGRVRVAAPLLVSDEAVRLAVISKLAWIKRQQGKFEEQDRETPREYVSGESHYFQGRRYLLNVTERDGNCQVVVRNKKIIDLFVRPQSTMLQRERVMLAWYRVHLRQTVPPLIVRWESKIGVQVADWGIKQMKTKWGTCNIEARRIWLNLELAKKPAPCLEFILVHEMVHLLERRHNEAFVDYMNQFMPQWRLYRDQLNRAPLKHETWSY